MRPPSTDSHEAAHSEVADGDLEPCESLGDSSPVPRGPSPVPLTESDRPVGLLTESDPIVLSSPTENEVDVNLNDLSTGDPVACSPTHQPLEINTDQTSPKETQETDYESFPLSISGLMPLRSHEINPNTKTSPKLSPIDSPLAIATSTTEEAKSHLTDLSVDTSTLSCDISPPIPEGPPSLSSINNVKSSTPCVTFKESLDVVEVQSLPDQQNDDSEYDSEDLPEASKRPLRSPPLRLRASSDESEQSTTETRPMVEDKRDYDDVSPMISPVLSSPDELEIEKRCSESTKEVKFGEVQELTFGDSNTDESEVEPEVDELDGQKAVGFSDNDTTGSTIILNGTYRLVHF